MTMQNPIPEPGVPSIPAAPAAPTDEELAQSIFESTGTEHLEAFEATRADREALVPEALLPIFADVHTAASRVIGATLRAAELDDELAALPGVGDVRLRAQRYAKAASQAQSNYLNTFTPPEGFLTLIEDLKVRREKYLQEAQVLVWREILSDEQLAGLNRTTGYRAVVYDVMRLCSMFRDVMPRIAGKSFVTAEEVTSVYALAAKAEKMLELRDDKERVRAETNETRQRAFTLMSKSYDQLRRALTFIIWDAEKLDAIAPSMQVNTRRGRPAEDPALPEPAAPVQPDPAAPAAGGTAAAAPVAPGLPGASPFITR